MSSSLSPPPSSAIHPLLPTSSSPGSIGPRSSLSGTNPVDPTLQILIGVDADPKGAAAKAAAVAMKAMEDKQVKKQKGKGQSYDPFTPALKKEAMAIVQEAMAKMSQFTQKNNVDPAKVGKLLSSGLETLQMDSWQSFQRLRAMGREDREPTSYVLCDQC